MKTSKWTSKEVEWLKQNVQLLNVDKLCEELNRSEMAVNIKIHRLRLPVAKGGILKERVSKNICLEMISKRINPEYFKPGREFYNSTGIGQKRFWQLFRGEKNMTKYEYVALAKELNITLEEGFELHQLELNFTEL